MNVQDLAREFVEAHPADAAEYPHYGLDNQVDDMTYNLLHDLRPSAGR